MSGMEFSDGSSNFQEDVEEEKQIEADRASEGDDEDQQSSSGRNRNAFFADFLRDQGEQDGEDDQDIDADEAGNRVAALDERIAEFSNSIKNVPLSRISRGAISDRLKTDPKISKDINRMITSEGFNKKNSMPNKNKI